MSALQELLNLGLVDIGSDDSRFEKIQSTVAAFTTKLKEEPDLLIPATFIAIDSEVDEDNALFALVEKLLIVEWRTLRNTHVNRPRELLRSIIIDALITSIDGNPEVAGVIYNTALSPYKFGQVRLGKAAVVVKQLLKDAGHIAETEAVNRAGLVAPVTKKRRGKKLTSEIPTIELGGVIKTAEILTDVERASGPHNEQNVVAEDPNTVWPNQGPPWSYQFAPRMTSALVKAVNLGNRRIVASLSKSLETYLKTIEEHLKNEVRLIEQRCTDESESHNSSRMRLDVLWWSEALYSPFLGCSYRDLNLLDAAVTAATDLTTIVPALSPASVNYVLGETVHRLSRMQENDAAWSLTSYLDELAKSQTDFGEALHYKNEIEVPLSFLGLIGEVVSNDERPGGKLRTRTHLDGSLELSFGEFAMWIFQDLQAKRLVEELRS